MGVSTAGARWAGAEMGAVAVCSARSGCLRRGVVHGDGKGSAGHAGVGLGWQTGKLTFTHGPAALISYSSTSSRKSRVLIEEQDHVVIDQRHSTLQTRRHGVVGLQQGPPELAWAARSECILRPVTHMDLNQSARGFLYARGYPHDSA